MQKENNKDKKKAKKEAQKHENVVIYETNNNLASI